MPSSIRSRILLGAGLPLLLGISSVAAFFVWNLDAMEDAEAHRLRESAVEQVLRARVGVVYGLVDAIAHELPDRAAAQQRAIAELSALRFGDDGASYAWIHSREPANPARPRMVMHPTKPALNGTDVADFVDKERFKRVWFQGQEYPADAPEVAGIPATNLFVEMNAAIGRSATGDAVVHYYWPDPSRDLEVGYEKLSYVRLYEPWGWVLGSGEYADAIDAAARTVEARMREESARSVRFVLGICVVVALVAGAALWWLAERVSAPVRDAAESLERVARGSLTVGLTPVGGAELERMARAFNTTLARIRDALGAERVRWDAVASGREVQVQLTTTAERFGELSERLSAASADTSQQATALSAASRDVSDQISRVADGTSEISSAMNVIASNTATAAGAVRRGADEARAAIATVERLGVSSQEIGGVVTEIAAIAEQTNLLALNASIEAARAGAAGRGFAVVASEVKELAKGTKRATETVQGRVEALQRDSSDAANAMTGITTAVAELQGLLEGVAAAVEEQAVISRTIAQDVTGSAGRSAEITRKTEEIALRMGDVDGAARQLSAAAADLHQLATRLHDSSASDAPAQASLSHWN